MPYYHTRLSCQFLFPSEISLRLVQMDNLIIITYTGGGEVALEICYLGRGQVYVGMEKNFGKMALLPEKKMALLQ